MATMPIRIPLATLRINECVLRGLVSSGIHSTCHSLISTNDRKTFKKPGNTPVVPEVINVVTTATVQIFGRCAEDPSTKANTMKLAINPFQQRPRNSIALVARTHQMIVAMDAPYCTYPTLGYVTSVLRIVPMVNHFAQ